MAVARWGKVATGFLGVALLGVVAGGLALHAAFDPENVKATIRDKARAALSRDIRIGSASLELLPWPTIHVKKVASTDFAAERISARLSLLPLLVGKFAFDEVALKDGVASLDIFADGAKLEVKIEAAHVEALPRMHHVRLDAQVSSHGRPLHVKASFDDLSQLGKPDAATPGSIMLDWGKTRIAIDGRLPLNEAMKGEALKIDIKSDSPDDFFAFLGIERGHAAAVRANADVREANGLVRIDNASFALGQQRVTGTVQVNMADPARRTFTAQVQSDHLDWKRALRDAGAPERPPLAADEMFYDDPLPWGVITLSHTARGTIEAAFGTLVLPNGITTTNARSHMIVDGDKLDLKPFSAKLLGGSATGSMHFEGGKKRIHIDINAANVLLERWFHERGRPIPFKGGPMNVKASITVTGPSMKQLAASMTGPVSIRMGEGVYASKVAGDWEERMAHFTKKHSSEEIDFECVTASLPFRNGRAAGDSIIGGRSTVSRLLLSGYVDLREQQVDLHGKVHPKPAHGVGLAAIAGDIEINGKIRKMRAKLDPAAKPIMVARAGAALATGGLSLLAESKANSRPGPDPCEAVGK